MNRKFLSLIIATALTTSLVVMPAISANALEVKPAISKRATYTSNLISNPFIQVTATDSGKYTIGTTNGMPDNPNDDGIRLLYGYSNAEVLKVGDNMETLTNGGLDGSDGNWNTTVKESNSFKSTYNSTTGVNVERILKPAKSPNSDAEDSAAISYKIINSSNETKVVSFKTMLDTCIANTDTAPFNVPGIGQFKTGKLLTGTAVPNYWFAFDDLENPTAVSKYSFPNGSKPNKIVFTHWQASSASAVWDHQVDENIENGDSCVIMYWENITLAPGESKNITNNYGVSSLNTQVSNDLSVSVLNNNVITANEDKSYDEYQTTATVKNSGDAPLNNVVMNIEIPEEFRNILSLNGDASRSIGILAIDQEANEDIKLNVLPGNYYDDIKAYFNVKVKANATTEKTVKQEVTIKANCQRSLSATLNGGNNVTLTPNNNNEYDLYKSLVNIKNNGTAAIEGVKVELIIPEEYKNDLTLEPVIINGQGDGASYEVPDTLIHDNLLIPATEDPTINGWNLKISPNFENRNIPYKVKVTYGDETPIVLNQTLNIKGLTAPVVPVEPEAPATPEAKPSTPSKTNDPSNIPTLATALLGSGIALFASKKKK